MPKYTLQIATSDAHVYNFLLNELSKSLNHPKDKLLNFSQKSNMQTAHGKVEVNQIVTTLIYPSTISFTSSFLFDTITTTYNIEPLDTNNCSLSIEEKGTSTKTSRRLNYILFSMVGLRNIAIKKIERRAIAIKSQCEEGKKT